jgi:hypothetical protein
MDGLAVNETVLTINVFILGNEFNTVCALYAVFRGMDVIVKMQAECRQYGL